jgi:hypothetical protein
LSLSSRRRRSPAGIVDPASRVQMPPAPLREGSQYDVEMDKLTEGEKYNLLLQGRCSGFMEGLRRSARPVSPGRLS